MKLYGHTESTEIPLSLTEVTFSANPAELREIARFLLWAAEDQERRADAEYVHMSHHVIDANGNCIWPWEGPDVIVTPASARRSP